MLQQTVMQLRMQLIRMSTQTKIRIGSQLRINLFSPHDISDGVRWVRMLVWTCRQSSHS